MQDVMLMLGWAALSSATRGSFAADVEICFYWGKWTGELRRIKIEIYKYINTYCYWDSGCIIRDLLLSFIKFLLSTSSCLEIL